MAVSPSHTRQHLLAKVRLLLCFRTRLMKVESMRQLFLEDAVPALTFRIYSHRFMAQDNGTTDQLGALIPA
jgi:hypothetical protein